MRKSCSARVHIGAEYALGAPNSGKKAAMAVGKSLSENADLC
jgi:hypothetical protein